MSSNYVLLATIDIPAYDSLRELYADLLAVKKDVFAPNERILIRHTDKSLSLVNEILAFIDIPDYFVIRNQIDSTSKLDFALSETHCIYPWANLEINSLGSIRPCCLYTSDTQSNIKNSTLRETYNNIHLQELRQQLRNGERPVGCSACWRNEAVGIPSMRQFAKHKFKDIYYTLDYINDSYKNLQVFDLKLGNACNLSCRICNRTSSSAIAEQEYTTGVISIAELHELKQTVNWADTDIFWNQMLDTVQNLKYLDLYGGEPLISRSHFNFLRKLIDLDVAKDIKIDYNTNGTVFSKKFFDLWDNFKEIKLSFSIDDIGLRFEQQRCGASWLTVCENINKFNQHRSNKFITEVFPTINTQNVFWIPELIAWINTQEFDYVGFNVLTTPIEFDIQNMNYKDKQKIIDKLQQYVNQHPIITSIIQLLSN